MLTLAFAGATVIITYYFSPRGIDVGGVRGVGGQPEHPEGAAPDGARRRLPPLVGLALKVLIISVVLLILYLVLLRLCTVATPGNTARFQIGFDKFEWSLTDEGKKVKAES